MTTVSATGVVKGRLTARRGAGMGVDNGIFKDLRGAGMGVGNGILTA